MDKKYIIGQANIANDPTAVKFTPQSLTSEQKVQAQTNIGLNDIQLVKTNDLEYTLKVGGIDSGIINIPKDQFLKSVEFNPDTKILTFVFTTSTGDVTTTIDMSALIDVYTAGNGLLLIGNQFSINLDGNSNNSLTISADGLMLDKTQFASTAEFQNLSAQVTDNTAQIETLNSNYVKSPVKTSAFLSGQNTLANVQSSFSVESNNRFDYDNVKVRLENGTVSKIENGYTATGNWGGSSSGPYHSNGWLFFNIQIYQGDIISFDYNVIALNSSQTENTLGMGYGGSWNTPIKSNCAVGDTGRAVKIAPANAASFYVALSSMTVEITNICISKVTDTYTPFLTDGTAVTVRKANKNLAYFDNQTSYYLSVSDNIFTANGTATTNVAIPAQYVYVTAGTYTLGYKYISGTVKAVEGTSGDIGYIRFFKDDNTPLTQTVITMRQNNYQTEMSVTVTISENCFARLYPLVANNKIYTNYKFVCSLEKSDAYTGYEKPVYEDITTAVGQSINITQYDNITNLSVLTEGGSLSGQFILSTQYELNDKLTPLFGTFASRPTTTQPYAILYIATDQTGENKVTILPANTDGSVSGNWISI